MYSIYISLRLYVYDLIFMTFMKNYFLIFKKVCVW